MITMTTEVTQMSDGRTLPVLRKPAPTGNTGSNGKGKSKTDELVRALRYQYDFDVIKEVVSMYRSKSTGPNEKLKILLELMPYHFPKLKSIEQTTDGGQMLAISLQLPGNVQKANFDGLDDVVPNAFFAEEAKDLEYKAELSAAA